MQISIRTLLSLGLFLMIFYTYGQDTIFRLSSPLVDSVTAHIRDTTAKTSFSVEVTSEGRTLRGRIIDDVKKEPLIGVNVTIKESNEGAVTDEKGRFELKTTRTLPVTLSISYVGYHPKEVIISELFPDTSDIVLVESELLGELVVTARRRTENIQDIPIAMSAVSGQFVQDAGAFNVNRIKEVVPNVQLYSSNPRNTTLNIRGLGSTFGLTNDGLDPGVGFYVDGVYYSRAAATTLDFLEVERIEVLRGPQGTLFGKNTTAGAFNITTRKPSFKTGANFEVSYGSYQFVQAKASVTGPITKKVAARLSFSGTYRDGLLTNVATNDKVNTLSNIGMRGVVLYKPTAKVGITFETDYTRQRPNGYAQVIAGVAPTKRAGYRQFDSIIASLNYKLPSDNPFDRLIDQDTPWKSDQDLAGASINVDIKVGPGTLTSTTAYRFWRWGPSNDRDFTGLSSLSLSQAPSKHHQWSQEVRYAGTLASKLTGVFGIFFFAQDLRTNPYHTEESGEDQWRFVQCSRSVKWETPDLLEGYGIHTTSKLNTYSAAIFGQVDWEFVKNLHILPGIRLNYDAKSVDFDRQTYGGLQTTDSTLNAFKKSVYTDQQFNVSGKKFNVSGQLTVAYMPIKQINLFVTYSSNFKPFAVNLGGLPTDNGRVMTELAIVKPELTHHIEGGIKTTPIKNFIANATYFWSQIKDYQTNVQSAEVGVNRGYLANAEKVRVQGLELEGNYSFKDFISVYGNFTYTNAKYVKFTNAPVPLEETGGISAFKDISGSVLPGVSKLAGSIGGEFGYPIRFFGQKDGKVFVAVDGTIRSEFSSSPSPSQYLNVDGYGLMNLRIGYKSIKGVSFYAWSRKLLNKNYFEQLLPAAGNAGQYAGVLGDPRTFGGTVRYNF
jgi:iron complex outermembrane receptor protein